MTEKPEWFELAGEDQKPESSKQKRPKKRVLKVALFAAPLILVGGAFVAAQGEGGPDDAPANVGTLTNGSVSGSAATQGSQQSESIAPATTAPSKPSKKIAKVAKSKVSSIASPSATSTSGTKPGIASPNSGIKAPGGLNDPDHGAGLDRPKRSGDDEKEGIHQKSESEGEGEHHHKPRT